MAIGPSASKRGKVKAIKDQHLKNLTNLKSLMIRFERAKTSIRAKVERIFRVIKVQFGDRKVRCRSLKQNHGQRTVLVALANLYLARHSLAPATG